MSHLFSASGFQGTHVVGAASDAPMTSSPTYRMPRLPWTPQSKFSIYSADGQTYCAMLNERGLAYVGFDGELRNTPTVYRSTVVKRGKRRVIECVYLDDSDGVKSRLHSISMMGNDLLLGTMTLNIKSIRYLFECQRMRRFIRTSYQKQWRPNFPMIQYALDIEGDNTCETTLALVVSSSDHDMTTGGLESIKLTTGLAHNLTEFKVRLQGSTLDTFLDLVKQVGAHTQIRFLQKSNNNIILAWDSPSWEGTIYSTAVNL